MKRYVTIDFLRGVAIFMMIILHMISHMLDIDSLINSLDTIPIINIVALVVLPYLGGLAGFFLMISAIGNMVSMQKHLQKGRSVKDLVFKQVMGGILLLFFAMLTEGSIGYLGAIGNFFKNLDDLSMVKWSIALYRWNHFETIHTIAWCVIINGIVQGILSRNDQWKNIKRQVITYAVLAVIVVVLTQPIWDLVATLVPGYPWKIVDGEQIYTPVLGQASFWEIIRAPFLTPLAASIEPIFPYLAISFVGSIIGLKLSQPKEEIDKSFPKKMMFGGLITWIIGSIGVVVVIITVMDSEGIDTALNLYKDISFHRHWAPDKNSYVPVLAWVWQFLTLNGFGLMGIMLMFRLVEFRGRSEQFAKKTTFIRRFGFVAFTNYAYQWIYWIVWYLFTIAIGLPPYSRLNWGLMAIMLLLGLGVYHIILRLWEKARYIGSIEWCIASIAYTMIPLKRKSKGTGDKWYERGALDVDGAFYNPEWVDIVPEEEIPHDQLKESKMAFKLSLISLLSLIFFPAGIITFGLARSAKQSEGDNKYNKIALIISIICIMLVIAFLVFTAMFTLSDLGLSL